MRKHTAEEGWGRGTQKVVRRDTAVNKYLKNSINEIVLQHLESSTHLLKKSKYFQANKSVTDQNTEMRWEGQQEHIIWPCRKICPQSSELQEKLIDFRN